jgi:signal transduction histidine kinase
MQLDRPNDGTEARAPAPRGPLARVGLSGKLLLLTILFVMIGSVLIYVPAIANYRLMWLSDRLAAARTAALVLDASPDVAISPELTQQLLMSVGAHAIALKRGDTRRLLSSPDTPQAVTHEIDVRKVSLFEAIYDAFDTLLCEDNDTLRVVGEAPKGGEFIEIVIDERPLRDAMLRFSGNLLLIALAISGIAGVLVYASLSWLLVRPMRRLTARMVAFAENPEDPARIVVPGTRGDELGVAERALAGMQEELAQTLQQKSRLAALGLAVSKINHDLRNLLASAQLLSDRIAGTADPTARRLAPRLMAALDRAIAYCEHTLAYGRAQEPPPQRRQVDVARLVEEVHQASVLDRGVPIGWVPAIERGLAMDADPDQMFRVLLNLVKNSIEALEARAPNLPERDQIRIVGRREGAVVVLQIADTGPGLPERARQHLFEPFQGAGRRGGTGLGLAIAAELVRAHGGEIRLAEGTIGATFRIIIPDRPVALDEKRAERASA